MDSSEKVRWRKLDNLQLELTKLNARIKVSDRASCKGWGIQIVCIPMNVVVVLDGYVCFLFFLGIKDMFASYEVELGMGSPPRMARHISGWARA
jgi:hypothetical protein